MNTDHYYLFNTCFQDNFFSSDAQLYVYLSMKLRRNFPVDDGMDTAPRGWLHSTLIPADRTDRYRTHLPVTLHHPRDTLL